MQVFQNPATLDTFEEFYQSPTMAELKAKMGERREEMKERGYTVVKSRKVGRNEICPCGSGVKFKKCCLSQAL